MFLRSFPVFRIRTPFSFILVLFESCKAGFLQIYADRIVSIYTDKILNTSIFQATNA